MAKTEVISIQTDSDTKKNVENLYSEFGITVSDAVNIFFRISLMHNGLPFNVQIPRYNDETLKAVDEMQDMKQNPDRYRGFRCIKELFEELESDDEV